MQQLVTDSNQVVALFDPKEGLSLPTEEAIKNLLKEVKSEKLTPRI